MKSKKFKLNKQQKKLVFVLMIPTVLELFVVQLFSVADTMMLGNAQNSTSMVAAVGIVTSPINVFVNSLTAFCIGITSIVSQLYGQSRKKDYRNVVAQSLVFCSLLGAFLTVVCIASSNGIVSLFGANDEIYDYAVDYFRIIAAGFFFHTVTACITASFRGVGITNLSMYYNIGSGVINVILNYLLIYGKLGCPELGCAGAALATTISRGIGCLAAIICLFKLKSPIKLSRDVNFKMTKNGLKDVLKIGSNCALEQIILQTGAAASSRIVAFLPTSEIASFQICMNMEGFSWIPGNACGAVATTLSGRSMGEKHPKKAESFTYYIWRISLLFALTFGVLFFVFGHGIASLYSTDSHVVETSTTLILFTILGMPGIMTHSTFSGAMRGAGETKRPIIASMISLWIFRVALGYICICTLKLGVISMRNCCNIDNTVRAIMVLIFFLCGKWKTKSIINKQ